jgi:zinc transport system substrate-binding protein
MVTSLIGLLIFSSPNPSASAPLLTSILPLKFIIQEITGSEIQVESLTSGNVSSHIYEPTPSDMRKLHQSQVVFFVDPSLDHWMIRQEREKSFAVLDLIPTEAKKAFVFHHHDHHHHHGHTHSGHRHKTSGRAKEPKHPYDPHFWMDPLTVQQSLPGIVKVLCETLPQSCKIFEKNAEKFSKSLSVLDKQIRQALEEKKVGPIMTTHDFLNYFCQRYGLDYVEPIEPIPGKEPSPKDILRLHRLVKEKNLKVLFSEPQLNVQSAKNLAESAGIRHASLDPIGADKSIQSYSSLILWNLKQLVENH